MAVPGSSANSSVLFREVHKNAWLRRLPSNEKKTGAHPKRGERVWAVFCVHDDAEPFLETYPDQKVAAAHKPEWSTSLAAALHVSPTICPQDEEFEFVVTMPDSVVRLTASSWELMMEWVDGIGSKLREMRILSPKENVYSRMPETRAPLLPTRDPNSPLPLPPAVPPMLVPGVEPLVSVPEVQDGFASQSDESDQSHSLSADVAVSTSAVYISRLGNSPPIFASSSNTLRPAPPSPSALQNVTVIEVSNDSFNFNAIGSSLDGMEDDFNDGHDDDDDVDEEEEEENDVDDEDDDEEVFPSPVVVTPTLLPRLPSQLNRNNSSSNSRSCSSSSSSNINNNVANNNSVCTSQTESGAAPDAAPGGGRRHRSSNGKHERASSAAEERRARCDGVRSEPATAERPANDNAVAGATLYEHIFLSTNRQRGVSSPAVNAAEPVRSQASVSTPSPTPADLLYSQVQDRVVPPVGAIRARSGLRPARRRSSDSSAPTSAGGVPVAADRIRRLQPPPYPFRQNPGLAESNTTNAGGVRLTLREQQVLQLRREMLHPGGVRLQLRRKDCLGSIALVDAFGAVWIAGWKQKDHPMLYNALHIGDQVISVAGVRVQSSADAQKLIRGAPSLYVAFVIRRVPFGRIFALKRESEGQSLGLVRECGTAEVKDVVAGGLAALQGLPARTPSVDGLSLTTWSLTEVNGRPLNLFFKDNEVKDRLNAVGLDTSLLVQPSDLIKQIRKQLKAMRSYKDYIVQ